jgi:hypothetical protein
MRQRLLVIFYILTSVFCLLPAPKTLAGKSPAVSAPLPTFNDFSRVDRDRRSSGQLQTAESLELTHVDPALILRTAGQHRNDSQIQWGAAELLTDWTQKQAQFETALAVSGTNAAIALRFACIAAAKAGQSDLARTWLRRCQNVDPTNAVPWLADLWLSQKGGTTAKFQSPTTATRFNDYVAEATRARIRALEASGYSAYAARRLGSETERPVLSMVHELVRAKITEPAHLLAGVAASMQHGTFLITELVGQSLEKALLTAQAASTNSEAAVVKLEQLTARRNKIKQLVADTGRFVDAATEAEMVQYYEDVLTFGEEEAMNHLAKATKKTPSTN